MNESLASPENPRDPGAAIAYCAAEVRRFDPDRYFSALFAGDEGRCALMALYAFNLEIAKTRETVSEPMLGQIRLQWWREAIEGIYVGAPRSHAVVTGLAHTVARDDRARPRLERLIDGRERDLEDGVFDTVDDLVAYADATAGELNCLALEALGVADAETLDAGRNAGIVWALTGLIKAIPFHASQGRCFLPRSLTDAHDVSLYDLYAGRPTAGLAHAVAAMAEEARSRLAEIDAQRKQFARLGRPVLAPATLVRGDLRYLAKAEYDVFALRPQSPFGRQLRIVRSVFSGRV